MKVATWNVNSLRARVDHVVNWLNENKPEVLALQELKLEDKDFPMDVFKELGYHICCFGQKTYNGVGFLSTIKPETVFKNMPGFEDVQSRVLAATFNDVRVINVYVPNGNAVDSERYHYKLEWLAALADFVKAELAQHPKLILLGDFNVAPADEDVHDPVAWEGGVLVSPPERAAYQEILACGLHDAFRLTPQPEKSFSWWDYRRMGFRRNAGLRIDLILISAGLLPHSKSVIIDKAPRKWERPSDHTPVVIELGDFD
jgi:exodeoxyribonuclease-3